MNIDDILAASDNLDKMSDPTQVRRKPQPAPQMESISIEELDKLTQPSNSGYKIVANEEAQSHGKYNAKSEIDQIKEARINGLPAEQARRTNLPSSVIESMIANPCILDPTIAQRDSQVEAYAKNMKKTGSNGNAAFNKMKSLMERTDTVDANRMVTAEQQFKPKAANMPITENHTYTNTATPSTGNSSQPIDYGIIKMIIENVLDEKLSTIKGQLNESSSNFPKDSQLVVMELGKTFRLVDNNDHVYECQMKYIGNRKKK